MELVTLSHGSLGERVVYVLGFDIRLLSPVFSRHFCVCSVQLRVPKL